MPHCCAVGCSNSFDKGFIMKKFPRNPDRRNQWAAKVKRDHWAPTNYSVLCQNHFEDADWLVENGRKTKFLKPNAVPSIFLHIPAPKNRKDRSLHPTSTASAINQSVPSPTKVALNKIQQFHTYTKKSSNCEPPPDLNDSLTSNNDKDLDQLHLSADSSFTFTMNNQEVPETILNIQTEVIPQDEQLRILEVKCAEQAKIIKSMGNQCFSQRKKTKHFQDKFYKVEKKLKSKIKSPFKKVFNDDQFQFLRSKFNKVRKWSVVTMKKAFQLRFSCGSAGYTELLKQNQPLPSIRTLTRHLEHIKFKSGILHEVFDRFAIKVNAMQEIERDCLLLLDEMAITPKREYDVSTGAFTGDITLPGHSGVATHALTFMLGGINSRWKQTVAYYFTGDATDGSVLKNIILEIIRIAENIKLKVHAVTTDMGPVNQAFWRSFGISCSRSGIVNKIVHPEDPARKFFFFSDVPHVFKNIRKMLIAHEVIIISEDIAKRYALPSTEVKLDHIKQLCEHQRDLEIKLVPKLDSRLFTANHFDKMKVSSATKLISRQTAHALEYLVHNEGFDKNFLTTAWFIKTVSKWFELMTSRHPVLALSLIKIEAHNEAVIFLKEIINLFESIKFGEQQKVAWKPVQTGVTMSTQSILEIQEFFLKEMKYNFLLTSRFTQDCLENLFSVVRLRQPIPSALQFQRHLKLITVSQYMRTTSTSNYDMDEREFLGDFFKKGTTDNQETSEKEQQEMKDIYLLLNLGEMNISKSEENSLYHISGYIIHKIRSLEKVCDSCINDLLPENKNEIKDEKFTQLLQIKEYKTGSLLAVNKKCFSIFQILEENFRGSQILFPEVTNKKNLLISVLSEKLSDITLPTCHDIKKKIINRFVNFRLRIYAEYDSIKNDKVDYGSKSTCMRAIAKKLGCKKSLIH